MNILNLTFEEERWQALCRGPTSVAAPALPDLEFDKWHEVGKAWSYLRRQRLPEPIRSEPPHHFTLTTTWAEAEQSYAVACDEVRMLAETPIYNHFFELARLEATSDLLASLWEGLHTPRKREIVVWLPPSTQLDSWNRLTPLLAALAKPVSGVSVRMAQPMPIEAMMPRQINWEGPQTPRRIRGSNNQPLELELPRFRGAEQVYDKLTQWAKPASHKRRDQGKDSTDITLEPWEEAGDLWRRTTRFDVQGTTLADIPQFEWRAATFTVEDLGKPHTKAPRRAEVWPTRINSNNKAKNKRRHTKKLARRLRRKLRRDKLSLQPCRARRRNANQPRTPTETEKDFSDFATVARQRTLTAAPQLDRFIADINRDAERARQQRKGRTRRSYGERLLRGSTTMKVGRWHVKFHQVTTLEEKQTRKGELIEQEREVWVPDYRQTTWPDYLDSKEAGGDAKLARDRAGKQTRWLRKDISPAALDQWETTAEWRDRQHLLGVQPGLTKPFWVDEAEWERRKASPYGQYLEITAHGRREENPDLTLKLADARRPRPKRREKRAKPNTH